MLARQFLLWFSALLLVVTVFIPAAIVGNWSWGTGGEGQLPGTTAVGLRLSVYDNGESLLREMELEDYIVGVVAAEMPASFELEALKAQAVVARTYAVSRMRIFGGRGCPDHPKADICTNPDTDQGWNSREEQRERWGPIGFYLHRRKLERAVSETAGLIITYHGQPIDAVYHSTSGGKTEAASAVWGEQVDYLRSVSSPYEEEAPKYSSSTVFAVERLAKLLGISASELEAALTDGGGIQVVEHTPGGRAATVAVGDHTWSGRELRELLNLPSTWFEVSLDDDGRIVFTNRGYGHGVGLSQYGANGMAEKGLPYTDIIKHYYKGVSVRPIFTE